MMKAQTSGQGPFWAGLITASLALAGCTDAITAPEPRMPSTIELIQPEVRMGSLGETAPVQVRVLDQHGRVITNAPIVISVLDTAVVSLTLNQELLARSNGVTLVRVTIPATEGRPTTVGYRTGFSEAQFQVTVEQEVGSITLPAASAIFWALGERLTPNPEIRDPGGNLMERKLQVRWESENPGVIEVTPQGQLVSLDDGVAKLRAITEGTTHVVQAEVRAGFGVGACVTSSASRASLFVTQDRIGTQGICDSEQLRAFAPGVTP